MPLLNITKLIGTSVAKLVPDCYEFIFIQFLDYERAFFEKVNGNWNDLILSFLFT